MNEDFYFLSARGREGRQGDSWQPFIGLTTQASAKRWWVKVLKKYDGFDVSNVKDQPTVEAVRCADKI